MKKVLVICGATASGKTPLAVACAKKLNSEVISADSQLVYCGLNVGTAKPTAEEMQGVKHHLIDVISPKQTFSVSDYRDLAYPVVKNLVQKEKIPVVCGGTGFYINSLLFDYGYGSVAADEMVRKKYEALTMEKGKEYVFELLRQRDEQTAQKLHPNDVKRVVRALEILEVGGIKKSQLNDGKNQFFDYLAVAIDYPREELYDRIEARVNQMFASGLVEEVKTLLAQGIDENCQCMQAIGYKEVLEGLKLGQNQSTMRDVISKNTRHYAKRQITFFKKLPNIIWLKPEQATAKYVTELLHD